MPDNATAHQFLKDLDAKLWAAACKLQNNPDAAQVKHAVLGLIFLKCVSDAFDARRAAMYMAIRGIDYNFGSAWANSFTNDQHPDLRAAFVMANPPFNVSDWWDEKLQGDPPG